MRKAEDATLYRFQLSIRKKDEDLWWWCKQQAQERRMHVSQFVMLCIEQEMKRK